MLDDRKVSSAPNPNKKLSVKGQLEKMIGRAVSDDFIRAISPHISLNFFEANRFIRFNAILKLLNDRTEKHLVYYPIDTRDFLIAVLKSYPLLQHLQNKLGQNGLKDMSRAVHLVGDAILKSRRIIEEKLNAIDIIPEPDFSKGIAAFVSWNYFDKSIEDRFTELNELMNDCNFRKLLLKHRDNGKKFLIWSVAQDEVKLESFKQQSVSDQTAQLIDECLESVSKVTYISSAPSVRLMLSEFWRTITGRPFAVVPTKGTLSIDEEKAEHKSGIKTLKQNGETVGEQIFRTVYRKPLASNAAIEDTTSSEPSADAKFVITVTPPTPHQKVA